MARRKTKRPRYRFLANLDQASQKLFAPDSSDTSLHRHILSRYDTTLGGLPAKALEATSDLGHEEIVATVNANSVGYIVTIYTPEADWQKLQPVLQTFLHSIEFDQDK